MEILSGIDNLFLIIDKIKNNNKNLITIDFDDTLLEKTGIFKNRIKLFKTIVSSGKCFVSILTARTDGFKDILNFLEKENIDADMIITNVEKKGIFLNNVSNYISPLYIICHFEDDVVTAIKCIDFDIPTFLTAESLHDGYIRKWISTLKKSGELSFYHKHDSVKPFIELKKIKHTEDFDEYNNRR